MTSEERAQKPLYWWLVITLYVKGASDWLCRDENLRQPIRSITKVWVVKWFRYGFCAVVPQTWFRAETSPMFWYSISNFDILIHMWHHLQGCIPSLTDWQTKTGLSQEFSPSWKWRAMTLKKGNGVLAKSMRADIRPYFPISSPISRFGVRRLSRKSGEREQQWPYSASAVCYTWSCHHQHNFPHP